MKVIYLTWGETPRSYGIFTSQVINQFVETYKCTESTDKFYFVSATPIIHSGLIREKFSYFNELKVIRGLLSKIKFSFIPIFTTQNFIDSSKFTFNLMHNVSHLFLKNIIKKINPDIIHCRSYHAAYAALAVKNKYKFKYKIIFDGRGLWPEEVALKKKYLIDSLDYFFLKNIEKKLLEECDVTIAVSDTMAEHYKKIGVKDIRINYLSTDTDKLNVIKDVSLYENRLINFCYVGALSNTSWHTIDELYFLYKYLRQICKSKLNIITTSNHQDIKNKFLEFENEIEITSTKSINELKNILKNVDIGLLPYRKQNTFPENLIGETMLGTKTVEYICSGIPVLVNNLCGGASEIVKNNDFGLTYNPFTYEEITIESINFLVDKKIDLEKAKDLFDYKSNAFKYHKIYKELLKK